MLLQNIFEHGIKIITFKIKFAYAFLKANLDYLLLLIF